MGTGEQPMVLRGGCFGREVVLIGGSWAKLSFTSTRLWVTLWGRSQAPVLDVGRTEVRVIQVRWRFRGRCLLFHLQDGSTSPIEFCPLLFTLRAGVDDLRSCGWEVSGADGRPSPGGASC